jgi:hypothetical protein
MNALKRRDVVQRIPLHGDVSTMPRVKSALHRRGRHVLGHPLVHDDDARADADLEPFALSSSCSALSFMKNIGHGRGGLAIVISSGPFLRTATDLTSR